MSTVDEEVAEIVRKIQERFGTFGGEQEKPAIFALGVDVEAVVRFVLEAGGLTETEVSEAGEEWGRLCEEAKGERRLFDQLEGAQSWLDFKAAKLALREFRERVG